jgi:hypothetical protein
MQHLLIHLPYEAKVGGPVQYRWMYHIERALRYIKPIVGNRARVEESIAEAFILKEGWLPCYTCMLTSMGWTNILSKCLLYICVN